MISLKDTYEKSLMNILSGVSEYGEDTNFKARNHDIQM